HPRSRSSEDKPDGPDELGNLWWKGQKASLGPKLQKLCKYLWNEDDVLITNAIHFVWGSEAAEHHTFQNLVYRLNKILEHLGIPWTYCCRGDHVLTSSYVTKDSHGA